VTFSYLTGVLGSDEGQEYQVSLRLSELQVFVFDQMTMTKMTIIPFWAQSNQLEDILLVDILL